MNEHNAVNQHHADYAAVRDRLLRDIHDGAIRPDMNAHDAIELLAGLADLEAERDRYRTALTRITGKSISMYADFPDLTQDLFRIATEALRPAPSPATCRACGKLDCPCRSCHGFGHTTIPPCPGCGATCLPSPATGEVERG